MACMLPPALIRGAARAAAVVLVMIASGCSKATSPTSVTVQPPFTTDSLGTWITAAQGVSGVGWSAATGQLVFGRVVKFVTDPDCPVCDMVPEVAVAQVDPNTGAAGSSFLSGINLQWWLSATGRYVFYRGGDLSISFVEVGHSRSTQPLPGPAADLYPVIAPNDSLVAYYWARTVTDSVFVHGFQLDLSPGRNLGAGVPRAFSPDSRQLVVDDPTSVSRIVDITTLDSIPLLPPSGFLLPAMITWDATGLLEYDWDAIAGRLDQWDPRAGKLATLLNAPGEQWTGTALAASRADSHLLFVTNRHDASFPLGYRTTVWLLDRSGSPAAMLAQGQLGFSGAAFSPDGHKLALAMKGRIYLRNVP
jgi:hypothetical protein